MLHLSARELAESFSEKKPFWYMRLETMSVLCLVCAANQGSWPTAAHFRSLS